jgi:hypothetical protein
MPVLTRRPARKTANLRHLLAKEFLKGAGIELNSAADLDQLRDVDDGALNYVAALQVFESCGNVLAAFQAMHRVLKPGGVLFLTVSDAGRSGELAMTPLGHLAADYVHGPDQPDGIRQHFWMPSTWMELILAVQTGLDLKLEAVRTTRKEIFTVLRRPI